MRVRHDVALSLGAQVVGLALGLGAAVVTARVLGPDGQGPLQVAQAIAATGAQVVSIGVPLTAVQLIARRRERAGVVAAAAGGVAGAAGLLLLAAIALAAGVLSHLLLPDVRHASAIIILAAALAALYGVQISLLAVPRGMNDFRSYNSLVLLGKVASAAALLAAMVGDDPSPERALTALVVANMAVTVVIGRSVHRSDPLAIAGAAKLASELIRTNIAAYGGTLVQEVTYRADVLLLAALATASDVGIYAVAILVAELLWQLPNAAGLILLSRAAQGPADEATVRLLTAISSVVFTVLVVTGVVVALVAPVLVPLALGERFEPAVGPLVALLPGIAALGLWKVVVNDLVGRGAPRVKLNTSLLGAALVVVLDLVLIPSHGALGAALASSVAYSAAAASAVLTAARMLGRSPRAFVMPDAAARSAVRDVISSPRSLRNRS